MAGQKESVTVAKPRLPHWFVVFFVPISLTLLFISYFNPAILPYQHLGLFGDFLRYIVKQQTFLFCLVAFTCFTHITESLYCLILTRRYNLNLLDTISWFILVFVYGFFCLKYLKPIKEKST
ncbi:Hypothetical predicted protein [Octopus vulgaris]|uniref:Uncharacterized protein n=2 Tax=Octopus TaxID=6643 RepID=A0AA36ASC7_OCTVU|nr:transmembrane protein 254 [Octopus sinensis]CAI9721383.1 Hypothetical predicted protein [Octopus vulgaris]